MWTQAPLRCVSQILSQIAGGRRIIRVASLANASTSFSIRAFTTPLISGVSLPVCNRSRSAPSVSPSEFQFSRQS